jgi:hypothetical protein
MKPAYQLCFEQKREVFWWFFQLLTQICYTPAFHQSFSVFNMHECPLYMTVNAGGSYLRVCRILSRRRPCIESNIPQTWVEPLTIHQGLTLTAADP